MSLTSTFVAIIVAKTTNAARRKISAMSKRLANLWCNALRTLLFSVTFFVVLRMIRSPILAKVTNVGETRQKYELNVNLRDTQD